MISFRFACRFAPRSPEHTEVGSKEGEDGAIRVDTCHSRHCLIALYGLANGGGGVDFTV